MSSERNAQSCCPDPDIIRKNDDLTAQLSEQQARLNWLITFINSNGVLLKVSAKLIDDAHDQADR